MSVIALVALSMAGCADLLGADFDVHRASGRSDAAVDVDSGSADRSDKTSTPPAISADASGDAHNGDVASSVPDASSGRDVEYDDRPTTNPDAGDWPDGGDIPDSADAADGRDTADPVDATDGRVPIDASTDTPPDGPRTTGTTGSFVSLGAPGNVSSTIELRGHFISNTVVRGVTSTGISIEGKIQ